MGRGLSILVVFAIVLGAYVIWGPLQVTVNRREPAPVLPKTAQAGAEEAPEAVFTVLAVRKAENADSTAARKAVLAATTAPPLSPLKALPAKTIAGFPPVPREPLSNDQLGSAIKQSKLLRAQGQLVEARNLLSNVYLGYRTSKEQRLRLAEELEPISWELLKSRTVIADGQIYEVDHGDTLIKIAKPLHVPPEFIMKLNGMQNPRSLRPRQTLKLVQGPFDVLVEPSEYELSVLQHGNFVRRFPIGVGKGDSPTPVGTYKIGAKLTNPTYYGPGAPPVPARSPNNPLGTRWLDIGLGYGIHGTNEPETIGQQASRGCIRLCNEDVEELYDMLTEGSRVLIR